MSVDGLEVGSMLRPGESTAGPVEQEIPQGPCSLLQLPRLLLPRRRIIGWAGSILQVVFRHGAFPPRAV